MCSWSVSLLKAGIRTSCICSLFDSTVPQKQQRVLASLHAGPLLNQRRACQCLRTKIPLGVERLQ